MAEPTAADKEKNQVRFETELEFVQCLANPFYLESLAQRNLFTNEAFLNYLDYLQYWRKPAYARFLQYPQSLHHLQLLAPEKNAKGEHSASRLAVALKVYPNLAQEMASKQLAHWAGWREAGNTQVKGVNGMEKESVVKEEGAESVKASG